MNNRSQGSVGLSYLLLVISPVDLQDLRHRDMPFFHKHAVDRPVDLPLAPCTVQPPTFRSTRALFSQNKQHQLERSIVCSAYRSTDHHQWRRSSSGTGPSLGPGQSRRMHVSLNPAPLLNSSHYADVEIRTERAEAANGYQMATTSDAAPLPCGLDPMYSARDVDEFTLAIVGDLHLERKGAPMFERAREHLLDVLESGTGTPRVVQLGDLGGYNEKPGSMACFRRAHEYISGFQPTPAALVVGNHDLEGEDFETDEENLAAWRQVFGQRHYWSMELGDAVCIGISTVRFRSNAFSAHEVYIDDEQLSWFKDTLSAAGQRPVIVFSHAPPLGCGLTVIQSVHVKNRCAFLNHSSNADEFMRLVEQHPNICLWFSGHFHLSHNYMRSISVSGNCAFVQTGVIGDCNRDGYRHSRIVKASKEGYQLYTMDHHTGELRLDLEHPWRSECPPQPILPPQDQLCDSEDECWPFDEILPAAAIRNDAGNDGEQGTAVFERPASSSQQQRRWMTVGQGRLLSLEDSMLVEYNVASRAPIGVVFLSIEDGEEVVLLDRAGAPIVAQGTNDGDGEAVAAVELRDQSGRVTQRVDRNQEGGFFQVFQQNKWRLRKQREAAARAAAAVPVS